MVMSVESPRRSIREVVYDSVMAYHGKPHGKLRLPSVGAGELGETAGLDDDEELGVWEEEEGTVELVELGAERTKNVLILMSDTGGGHRASAEAIRDAFRLEFGDEYKVFVKDVCKESAGWPLNNMERSYKFMVKHVQLWRVAFLSTYPRWVESYHVFLGFIANYYGVRIRPEANPDAPRHPTPVHPGDVAHPDSPPDGLDTARNNLPLWRGKVEAGIKKYKPDVIISVHPLMQHIPLWVLKWQNLHNRVIFVTVITDLNTCHPTWFHTNVNRCYCPSEEVAKRASLDGLQPSQIRVFGLPIRPSFCRAVLSKDDLRVELEMDPDLPAVLLMGGGEGMGPVKKTAKALAESLYDASEGKSIGQLIREFETQMEKWMGACDCIITKAGPGTIAEALIRGLPIILNDFIPGQEVGNVPYVVDNGAGVFCKSSKQTAKLVARWFGPDSTELKKMSECALKLAQPEAVFDIVKDIHELTQEQGPMSNIPYALTSSCTSSFLYGTSENS
ncbi:putative monogalactosyldiacylglycerol synthase 3, chloroplastic [Dendrobium catenatum]|uniref:monogalactosyldiacylglycerol synthase n=1 Tax=Dendrobium catenatum TaxID=906689 RepID=A0A2I0WG46_9ASPA|nr:putative monogalactosyldiacylglycerol synthase 3, chloroplastic [Dendrobium catenatum]